ncbi:Elongation factor P [Candidatus Entotheonellaceae bacterium PAL068K]
MLITATQLRVGMLLRIDGDLFRILSMQHTTPGNKRGMVQTTLRHLHSGAKIDQRFRSTDRVDRAALDSQEMEYLYTDGDHYVFMHPETYEQIDLRRTLLEDSLPYLLPNTRVTVDFFDDNPIGITLPKTVELRITETEPALRGATATGSLKPATVETGLVVQVPQFVAAGDVVQVGTTAGEYIARLS